jgi:hypothetical protein
MPVSEAVAVTPSIETGSAGDNEGDMSVWMPAATSPDGGDEGPKSPSGDLEGPACPTAIEVRHSGNSDAQRQPSPHEMAPREPMLLCPEKM